eukprot:197352_1
MSYPKRDGNRIDTFIGQNEFFKHFETRCENATTNIFCGISFVDWDFTLPNGKKWWVFLIDLKKKTPNLIIRLLFWRNTATYRSNSGLINGDANDLIFIKQNEIDKYLQLKWDESPNIPHCHHGKYYVIDYKYALIGGMTLNGQFWFDYIHDTFMEIDGPSAMDVAHNFALRWNHNNVVTKCEAMQLCKTTPIIHHEEKKRDDNDQNNDKYHTVDAKIVWSCSANLYRGYEDGVQSVHAEYCHQFKNAKSSIYIESQHMGEYELLKLMKDKLESDDDVDILYVVPIWMKSAILKEKEKSIAYEKSLLGDKPRYYETFRMLSSLNKHKRFCLSGVYHDFNTKDNETSLWSRAMNSMICNQIPQYIHSKLCIVDGEWFTIGSANMVDISFLKDHTEINGCVYDRDESMKLLRELAVLQCNKQ